MCSISDDIRYATIIIPTYNEAKNIRILLSKIKELIDSRRLCKGIELIIVDDDSPDKTWFEALQTLKESLNSDIRLIVIRRIGLKGLSTAIVDGMKFSKGENIVVMDADLQHPPEYISDIIAKLKFSDIAIATRYRGGQIEEWSFIRLIISKIATLIAKILLPETRRLSDPMSGFFAVKRSVLTSCLDKLNPRGFKILLEILVKCRYNSVSEVPYTFRKRIHGKSKLGIKQYIDFLVHVLKLSSWRPFKFTAVGALGTLVNLAILKLLLILNVDFRISSALAIELSTLHNFALHEKWTFADRSKGSVIERIVRCFKFHLAVLPALLTQYVVAQTLNIFLALEPLIAQFIGIVMGFIVNYTLSELGVWKPRKTIEFIS